MNKLRIVRSFVVLTPALLVSCAGGGPGAATSGAPQSPPAAMSPAAAANQSFATDRSASQPQPGRQAAPRPRAAARQRPYASEDADLMRRAIALMEGTPLIDGHNDIPWSYRGRVNNQIARMDFASDLSAIARPTATDIPRLREGRVGAQFWSVYIPIRRPGGDPSDVQTVFEQIDFVHRLAAAYPDDLEIAYTADDVQRIFADGKIASMMGMEGGHSIGDSLAALRMLYTAGARYMTLTHSLSTNWADSSTDTPRYGGLTNFGEEVVREMNRIGMLVDLSHVSPESMHDALDVARAPVIFSHSSARAVTDHPRNVPDDVLRRLPGNDGIVMVTFVNSFVSEDVRTYGDRVQAERRRLQDLYPGDAARVQEALVSWRASNPQPVATLEQVADHIDHVKRVAGANHVGIGSDFDGASTPEGLEDVTTYPALIAELLRRGWTDAEIRGLLGENLLRVMRRVEIVAAQIRAVEPASEARIEDLDGTDSTATDGGS